MLRRDNGQLVDCFLSLHDSIANALPYRLWVILAGGGNDSCYQGFPIVTRDLVVKVTNQINRLQTFCHNKGYRLTTSHTMQRPREQGDDTRNSPEMRQSLADAYMLINNWIKKEIQKPGKAPGVIKVFRK